MGKLQRIDVGEGASQKASRLGVEAQVPGPGQQFVPQPQSPAWREVRVTFVKPGSLGLKLNPHPESGRPTITKLNAGTQAEDHVQLRTGLVIQSLGGEPLEGKSYTECLQIVKANAKVRPLELVFVDTDSDVTA